MYHIRDLLGKSHQQLLRELPETFTVVFDNNHSGEYEKRHTILSAMYWDYYRHFYNTPITEIAMIETTMRGKSLNANTTVDFCSKIALAIVDHQEAVKKNNIRTGKDDFYFDFSLPIHKEALFKLNDVTRNNAYNAINVLAERNVVSIDWLDFCEIVEQPEIIDIIAEVQECSNEYTIAVAYGKIKDFLMKSPTIENNAVVKAVRSGMVNINQVMQCVGIRGITTEVDGALLVVPVVTNFTLGLNDMYSFTADGRSAAKALFNSEKPLEDAVYFSRRLELLTMTVESLLPGDCGSTDYLNWSVRGTEYDEKGMVSYPGDLPFMVGKYYLNEETGELESISEHDAHNNPQKYVGRTLKLRSGIKCQHKDKHGICEVCFGRLSVNVSPYANLGHLCAATMTQQTNQSVLSTKHLDASAAAMAIVMSAIGKRHFSLNENRNGYCIKPEIRGTKMKMYVSRAEVYGMTDIQTADNPDDLSPSRISSIDSVFIERETQETQFFDEVIVSQSKRKASFTMEFIRYLREYGWETDSRNNFVIDLSKWNSDLPIMMLPDMEYSFSDHAKQIAELIEGSQKKSAYRRQPGAPATVLRELFTLVNSKLKVNLACLEVIIYAAMTPGPNDYRLARGCENPILGIADSIIRHRNISHAYAFQGISRTITSPSTFFQENREDSVLDAFFAPYEVMESIKKLRSLPR